MDCYDTQWCPGDCEGCPFYAEMVAQDEERRAQVALVALICLVFVGALVWAAAHLTLDTVAPSTRPAEVHKEYAHG